MMSVDTKAQIDPDSLIVDPGESPSQQNSSKSILNHDTVFENLYCSALYKAVNISRGATQPTDIFPTPEEKNETLSNLYPNGETSLLSYIPQSSTPKKGSAHNYLSNIKFVRKEKNMENSLDLCQDESKKDSEPQFSYQKFLHECDVQRRLTVAEVMRERIQNMYDIEKLIRDSLEHLKQTRLEEMSARKLFLESKILSDIQEREILNKPKREAQWAKDSLKEAQRIQERNQKVKEAEEEVRKKSEAILLKRKLVDKILFELQKEYTKKYKSMLESIKLCKDKTALTEIISNQTKMVKECAVVYESLLKKCKQGDVCEKDVESAKAIVDKITAISETVSKEITKINEKLESKKEEETVKKNETEQVTTPTQKLGESSSDLSDCFDPRSLQMYLNLKANLEGFEKSVEPLLYDDSTKKFRFNCQKAVTIPVNAISPISAAHLTDKYLKLYNLLSGRTVEVGDIKISASQHPLGVAFCKNLLAKKFVRQGDLTVSSKPDAAFSIAAVLASLWVDFPDFGQLVLAHFHAACPYLVPIFMPQVEGQSDEEYYKSLGYNYSSNGEVEKQDSFLKRMGGIMRLYSALIISKVRQPGKGNPLGLQEGWRWISALLNLEPRPDICATLLYDFLEVAGNDMMKFYNTQFKKLLAYICQEYFPKLEKVTPSTARGPIVRLEGFLQKILKEESIPPPNGVLPANFW